MKKDKRKSYHSSVDNNYVLFGKVIMVAISNNGDSKEEKCQVCYKTFTNKADVHSIIMTNMCENCYSNFKYSQDLEEELKKYEERYGD